MGINSIINTFQKKKIALEQRQTAHLNKKRLKIKAKYEREKIKDSHKKEIISYKKKLSGFKKKKNGLGFNIKKKIAEKSKEQSSPYWLQNSGNSTTGMFDKSSQPYWLQKPTPKKKKIKRGKNIIIRL